MEDGIPGQLQYHHKAYYKKSDCHRRQALIVSKEYTVEMCFPDEQTWHMTVDEHHSKKTSLHCMATSHLTAKQWSRVKSVVATTRHKVQQQYYK